MPTDTTLDELVADLFALDRRAEPAETATSRDCSGDCTDDGCTRRSC